jgi:hypothetical protein
MKPFRTLRTEQSVERTVKKRRVKAVRFESDAVEVLGEMRRKAVGVIHDRNLKRVWMDAWVS